MKTLWVVLIVLSLASTSLFGQALGVRLISIIDYGREAMIGNISRSVVWGGEKSIVVTSDYNDWMKSPYGSPRLLIYNVESRKARVPVALPASDTLVVVRMRDGAHFRLSLSTGTSSQTIREVSDYIVSLEDGAVKRLNDEEAKANLQELVRWGGPLKWPSDLAKPEALRWVLNEHDNVGALDDWAIWKRGLVLAAGPGMTFDGSYQGFSAFNIQGKWLFRFPYVITPVVDDGGMGGSTIEVSPGEHYLLINGHAYLRDIFPAEVPGVRDGRLEVGFIYRLLSPEEWEAEPDFKARYVRFDENLDRVELDLPIDGKRFSVAPGETPLWGMYGRLTSDKVNLREKPSIPSLVLTLMNKTVAGHEFKFVIRERTATKMRVGDLEDYWYRVTYEIPRGFSPDKRDHSWTGWVFGSYVEVLLPERQYGS